MLEQIVINWSANVRKESLAGREYLVAPLTLIVPGVLAGSKGALLYPKEEIARNYHAWNGVPIVVYHPVDNGQHVSARDPRILEKVQVGNVYRARITENGGRLVAEGWFDVERTKQVDLRVFNALVAGVRMEISTGLFTDNEPVEGSPVWNGPTGTPKPYDFVARNYRPDHLAILPDQVGACSLADGCGLLVNEHGVVVNKIVKLPSGKYRVTSEDGSKNLGEYATREEAEKRLAQVEHFKNRADNADEQCECGAVMEMMEDGKCKCGKMMESAQRGGGTGGRTPSALSANTDYILKAQLHTRLSSAGEEVWVESAQNGEVVFSKGGKTFKQKYTVEKDEKGNDVYNLNDQPTEVKKVGGYYRRSPGMLPPSTSATDSPPTPLPSPSANTAPDESTLSLNSGDVMNRDQMILWLTTNCECWKGQGDRDTLATLNDAKIQQLYNSAANAVNNAQVVNSLRTSLQIPETVTGNNLATMIRDKWTQVTTPQQTTNNGQQQQPTNPNPAQVPQQPMTEQQWLASAPPSVQATLNFARAVEQRERSALVERCVANVADETQKAALRPIYAKMDLQELAAIAGTIPQPQAQPTGNGYFPQVPAFQGMPQQQWTPFPAAPGTHPITGMPVQPAALYPGLPPGVVPPTSNATPSEPLVNCAESIQWDEHSAVGKWRKQHAGN